MQLHFILFAIKWDELRHHMLSRPYNPVTLRCCRYTINEIAFSEKKSKKHCKLQENIHRSKAGAHELIAIGQLHNNNIYDQLYSCH